MGGRALRRSDGVAAGPVARRGTGTTLPVRTRTWRAKMIAASPEASTPNASTFEWRWLETAGQLDTVTAEHAVKGHAGDAKFPRRQRDVLSRSIQCIQQRGALLLRSGLGPDDRRFHRYWPRHGIGRLPPHGRFPQTGQILGH